MAKIERFDGNLQAFGINATGTERTVYGAGTQSDTLDDNMNTAYLRGWGSLAAGVKPPREHFNGAMYTNSLLSAYLHQSGVAEWNTSQEYYSGGICRSGFGLYQSNIDSNTGNNPLTDSTNWAQIPTALSKGRNVIVNGNFAIRQLGETFTSAVADEYFYDGWVSQDIGSGVTVVRDIDTDTGPSGTFDSAMRTTITTGQPSIPADQWSGIVARIEGFRMRPLFDKVCTLSFWVKATVTGTYCIGFGNLSSDGSYISEYTIDTTDTWEKKTITLTVDTSVGTWNYDESVGLRIRFVTSCGTNYHGSSDTWLGANSLATSNQVNNDATAGNEFLLQEVQFELGGTPTPFDYLSRDDEQAICHRYLSPLTDLSTGRYVVGNGFCDTVSEGYVSVPLPVSMRTLSPSVYHYPTTATTVVATPSAATVVVTLSLMSASSGSALLKFTDSTNSLTANETACVYKSSTAQTIFLNANLA